MDNSEPQNSTPLVSLGLPVYNGDNFLLPAIESLLNQTFTDFELIISDNASTDKTESICRKIAALDNRVEYIRHPENRGAAWNFNFTVEHARGEYFKWVAHDDMVAPEFLQACVDALASDSKRVMAFTLSENIDENGNSLGHKPDLSHSEEPDPATRLRYSICIEHSCLAIFGLIRLSVLKKTPMIAPFVGSDRTLLAELGLHGPFSEIDRTLFFHREHAQRSTRAIPSLQSRAAWFDPSRKGRKTFPHWKMLMEYGKAIGKAPLSLGQKLKCLLQTVRWLRWHYRDLWRDITFHLTPEKK